MRLYAAVFCMYFVLAVSSALFADAGPDGADFKKLGAVIPDQSFDPAWGHRKVVLLKEERGVGRSFEPIELTVGLPAGDIADPVKEVRIVAVSEDGGQKEVPSQVYGISHFDEAGNDQDPVVSFTVAFLADVPALSKRTYLLYYGNPKAEAPSYQTDLKVSGEGLGLTIENQHYRYTLAATSGQIKFIEPKVLPGKKWNHKGQPIHWNPGVYVLGRAWDHTYSWNPPDGTSEVRGPVLFRITRWGKFSTLKEVFCSVTYTFYANTPYVRMQSIVEFNEDVPVQAVRNDEMVFTPGTFDRAAWKQANGRIEQVDLLGVIKDNEVETKGFRAVLSAEAPWICMYNTEEGIGFGSIHLRSLNISKYDGGVKASDPLTYFLNAGSSFIYWSRANVYPYLSDLSASSVVVSKGSMFLEDVAWVPFQLKDGEQSFQTLDHYDAALSSPLRIIRWLKFAWH